MEALDEALFEAWDAVSNILKERPWALSRRVERVSRKGLRRPVRAWCVALRASDSRIGAHEVRSELDASCAYKGYTHTVTLTGSRVAELVGPVWMRFPGLPLVEAADALGRDVRTIRHWAKKGRLRLERQAAVGRGGHTKHHVWGGPIDPQADDGRGPWEVWGTMWQGLGERVPTNFEQRLQRQARVRRRRGDPDNHPGRFCGWDWVCPGRVLATGQHASCGRVCKKLWLPLPAWTIGDYLGDRAGQAWQAVPRYEQVGRSFACARCWGVRFDPVRTRPDEAWNQFVSVVSGGLLYGREVERVGEGADTSVLTS